MVQFTARPIDAGRLIERKCPFLRPIHNYTSRSAAADRLVNSAFKSWPRSERGKARNDVATAVLLQGSLVYLGTVVCGHAQAQVQVVGIVVRLRWAVAMVLIAGIIAVLRRLLPLRILLVLHPSILKPDLDLKWPNKKPRPELEENKRWINIRISSSVHKRRKNTSFYRKRIEYEGKRMEDVPVARSDLSFGPTPSASAWTHKR